MKAKTVEDLLNDQLAACVAATEDCLAQSRVERDNDQHGHLRRNDLACVAKLMKASARLAQAMAQLRGERHQTIHVRRSAGEAGGEAGGWG